MTRDEAKDYDYDLDVDGYYYKDVDKVIDKIFDDFESRKCENCKYGKPILNNRISCENGLLSFSYVALTLDKDFGCNKWKSKT